jgi:peptidoglycan/LPS O-acetylase OafA/YrhL
MLASDALSGLAPATARDTATALVHTGTASKSLANIQALRAIAACLVIFQHIQIVTLGSFGVDIFFVISGFVIAYVGVNETPQAFIRKRIFRIVPLYWLGTFAVFAVAAVAPKLLNSTTTNVVDLVKSLFFIPYVKGNGLTHPVLFLGWTLNYEVLFYAIFAVALWFGSKVAPIIATMMILALVIVGMTFPIEAEPFRFWTRPITLEFLFGVWIFVGWHKGIRIRIAPEFAIAIGAVLLAFMGWEQATSGPNFVELLSFGIPAAAIVVLALSCEGKIRIPLLLLAAGDASYSLYLFHPYLVEPMQRMVAHVMSNPIVTMLALPFIFAVAVAFALLCYRIIERPSNLWLRATFMAPSSRTVTR